MPGAERKLQWQPVRLLRRHSRTLSGLLLLGVLAVLTAAGLRSLTDPRYFPLGVVEITGEFRYLDREQLQQAIVPFVHSGFFSVDVAAVRRVAEQLPWVHRASVQRVWPETLRIQIEEQQPVVHWRESGFLNPQGIAFFPEHGASGLELPWLSGPAGQERRVLEQYHRVRAVLAALGLDLQRLTIDERRAMQLQLAGGVQLDLGRAQPWQRLERFVRAWPEVLAARQSQLRSIDLRYSDGFSVVWEPQVSQDGTSAERAG